jgi:hypothetical protein
VTGKDVTAVLEDFGACELINADGWTYGPIRVERGGGIAGNLHEFWIAFPGKDVDSLGPYKSKRELKNALREVIVAGIKASLALHDLAAIYEQ